MEKQAGIDTIYKNCKTPAQILLSHPIPINLKLSITQLGSIHPSIIQKIKLRTTEHGSLFEIWHDSKTKGPNENQRGEFLPVAKTERF
jgi:hypothetical protein